MLEIFIEPKRTSNLKQAVLEAIEEGEYENLFNEIRDCFTESQIDEIWIHNVGRANSDTDTYE